MRADSIKLYRNTNSFRITYKTNRCLRWAMSQVGTAQNELRGLNSELHMSYTQLVPPRFKKDRDKLYKLLREARQKKLVRNFHWLVIHNRLCALTKMAPAPQIDSDGVPIIIPPPHQRHHIRTVHGTYSSTQTRGGSNRYMRTYTRFLTLCNDSQYDDIWTIRQEEELFNSGASENSDMDMDIGTDIGTQDLFARTNQDSE